MYKHFVYPFHRWYLGCFYLLAIVSDGAMNMSVIEKFFMSVSRNHGETFIPFLIAFFFFMSMTLFYNQKMQ